MDEKRQSFERATETQAGGGKKNDTRSASHSSSLPQL